MEYTFESENDRLAHPIIGKIPKVDWDIYWCGYRETTTAEFSDIEEKLFTAASLLDSISILKESRRSIEDIRNGKMKTFLIVLLAHENIKEDEANDILNALSLISRWDYRNYSEVLSLAAECGQTNAVNAILNYPDPDVEKRLGTYPAQVLESAAGR